MKTVAWVAALAVALEGSAIALHLGPPRHPLRAAKGRGKEEVSKMRTILCLLLLAAPVAAGPGSWKVIEQGDSLSDRPKTEKSNGNAETMRVETAPTRSLVDVGAYTDFCSPDQSGSGGSVSTCWLALQFAGSPLATEHRWRIESRIYGTGDGWAYANLDCDAWEESIQIAQISGDLENDGIGQLAVDDSGEARVMLSTPASVRVSLGKSRRTKGRDIFIVDSMRGRGGAGKLCRIRIDDYAEAAVQASSVLGAGYAAGFGVLRTAVLMRGSCRLPTGEVVRDFLVVDSAMSGGELVTGVVEPTGGMEAKEGIPDDVPTEEERGGDLGEEEEEEGMEGPPATDAGPGTVR